MGWLGPHAIGKVLEIPCIPLHLTACLPNHWLIRINTSHCFKLIQWKQTDSYRLQDFFSLIPRVFFFFKVVRLCLRNKIGKTQSYKQATFYNTFIQPYLILPMDLDMGSLGYGLFSLVSLFYRGDKPNNLAIKMINDCYTHHTVRRWWRPFGFEFLWK